MDKAQAALNIIINRYGAPSIITGVLEINKVLCAFEVGRANKDGSITGTTWRLENGERVGKDSFRIENTGRVTRFKGLDIKMRHAIFEEVKKNG